MPKEPDFDGLRDKQLKKYLDERYGNNEVDDYPDYQENQDEDDRYSEK